MGYEKKSCHFVCKDWEKQQQQQQPTQQQQQSQQLQQQLQQQPHSCEIRQNGQDFHQHGSGMSTHAGQNQQQQQQQQQQNSNKKKHQENLSNNISSYQDSDSTLQRTGENGSSADDEEGHLVYQNGDVLVGRYEIRGTLGEGAFGKVVECIDHSNNDQAHVAMKIVKNIDVYRDVALSEVNILKKMNSVDIDNQLSCVRMLDWFNYDGHICIVFELLGLSTYDLLQKNHFKPFSVDSIRHMAYQIIKSVRFLHRNKLTHTDLKPENILFVDSDYASLYFSKKKTAEQTPAFPEVRLVDFGNATFDHEYHASIVSTRHYRAPEVILELGWNHACDVWSLGCILLEYYLGLTIFQTHSNREHLAMMERVLGPIPTHLFQKTRQKCYVTNRFRLDWDARGTSGKYVRKHCKPLRDYMLSRGAEHQQLFDLIERMLEYDVSQRITLNEAMGHPFFKSLKKGKREWVIGTGAMWENKNG
ncbi:dual specificity protein kinase CLK1-like [Engraulis encrasicolus]|uniref:dual specificity protein kinase CLK1-like n=1 Tax=Engraulis encrasicolus TaxID=184585 RepID=UPI002FD0790C